MNGELTFGQRLRIRRERAGKTRAVLGGLVGRSEEWIKAVENGRLLIPRLPMLLRLADVLGVDDLAELTGDQSVPVATITKAGRDDAAAVAAAINATVREPIDDPSMQAFTTRVDEAWRLWNHSYAERGAVAAILPGLITEARRMVRSLEGAERRRALAELARVYHLAQLYFAHQPAAEFVWLSADRAMTAAQDADDPAAIAAAAWYYAHVYRGSAQYEAAEQTSMEAAELLDPDAGGEQLARWGQLQLGIGLGHAKAGRSGQAWRHWDMASRAAAARRMT
jgi:transcriptional regulator with XRE-family HTH domain